MMQTNKMGTLSSFIQFLENEQLLAQNDVSNLDRVFDTRLKLQKYTYLAGKLGLDHGYGYSLYLHGPYSPSLADEYYSLAENPEMLATKTDASLTDRFDRASFLNLVSHRDIRWLEIAATLVDQRHLFTDDSELVHHVERTKHNYAADYIRGVLSDLKKHKILDLVNNS